MLTVRADERPEAGLGHVTRCGALAEAWRRRGSATPWTVIDDYTATPAQQVAAREHGRVLVIDDHGTVGRYDADLVLDQNLGATAASDDDVTWLLGPRFALLREPFHRARRTAAPAAGRAAVVLNPGGSPNARTTALLDGVAVALHDRARSTTGAAVTLAGLDAAGVATTLAEARVMVGAAGSTAYECCAVGTPMVLFAVADNQEPVGRRLADAGAAVYLGRIDQLSAADVVDAVRAVERDPEPYAAAARAVTDGEGADRVAVQMRAFDLDLRPIAAGDCRLVWEWANDPAVRAGSFTTDPIPWDDHVVWFDRQLRDADRLHYIAAVDGRPVGQIRYDCDGDRALLGFTVAPDERGAGWGAPLLVAGGRRLRRDRPTAHIVGRVKAGNVPSARSFELAGFAG